MIKDWNHEEIDLKFEEIKEEFLQLSQQGKRTFLFVYAVGHGAAN